MQYVQGGRRLEGVIDTHPHFFESQWHKRWFWEVKFGCQKIDKKILDLFKYSYLEIPATCNRGNSWISDQNRNTKWASLLHIAFYSIKIDILQHIVYHLRIEPRYLSWKSALFDALKCNKADYSILNTHTV